MARLLTVVNERKRLRTQYRIHLENEYIAERKAEELKKLIEKREVLKARGVKNLPLTPSEVADQLRAHNERQA